MRVFAIFCYWLDNKLILLFVLHGKYVVISKCKHYANGINHNLELDYCTGSGLSAKFSP